MGPEAPCCGGGLYGICLLIIHFIFYTLTTSKSNIFQFSEIFNNHSPNFYTEMTCGFLIQLVFCKKKTMWFIGVDVVQETSAPPPKKILDPPLLHIKKHSKNHPKVLQTD